MKVSVRMLLYYDETGLLHPARVDRPITAFYSNNFYENAVQF